MAYRKAPKKSERESYEGREMRLRLLILHLKRENCRIQERKKKGRRSINCIFFRCVMAFYQHSWISQ